MRRVVLCVAVVVLVAGCGGSKTVTVTTEETSTLPQVAAHARVYFLRDGKVGPVARTVPNLEPATLLAEQAKGPTDRERAIGFDPGEAREQTAAQVFTLSQ